MIYRILGNIFLGDLEAFSDGTDLSHVNHFLLVLDGPAPSYPALAEDHKQLEVLDEESANLLEHLPEAMEYIDKALFPLGVKQKKHEGSVLVHCVAGVLRLVAVIVAYLMYHYKLTYSQALYAVKRRKENVEPNPGFKKQVELFAEMDFKVDFESDAYKQFVIDLELERDPTGSSLRQLGLFKPRTRGTTSKFELRCKRCRYVVATNENVEPHDPPGLDLKQSQFMKVAGYRRRVVATEEALDDCSHWFLPEPVRWMKDELDKLELEGKFLCPKCEAKVGGYLWQGSRCLCGRWMIPAIHLATAKVDSIATLDLSHRVQHKENEKGG